MSWLIDEDLVSLVDRRIIQYGETHDLFCGALSCSVRCQSRSWVWNLRMPEVPPSGADDWSHIRSAPAFCAGMVSQSERLDVRGDPDLLHDQLEYIV
jgi:hypothetical protein